MDNKNLEMLRRAEAKNKKEKEKRNFFVKSLNRLVETYLWHIEYDPTYFLDWDEYNKYQKYLLKTKSKYQKIADGGKGLRLSDPIDSLCFDWLRKYGTEKAQRVAEDMGQWAFGKESYQKGKILEPPVKRARGIPLKSAMILYVLLDRLLQSKDQERLNTLKEQLGAVDPSDSCRGIIRAYINRKISFWELGECNLPIPNNDGDGVKRSGVNFWAHEYKKKLGRSLFNGSKISKSRLIELATTLAFGAEAEYQRLLQIGYYIEGGLTVDKFYLIACEKMQEKMCIDYGSFRRQNAVQKEDPEAWIAVTSMPLKKNETLEKSIQNLVKNEN